MLRTDFAYDLPPELIAQEPRERGKSRMMVVHQDGIEHDSFANFPERLNAGDVLVINDTRVIPARLFAKPKAGMSRPIEILLTRAARARDVWEAWCKPAKRVKVGDELIFSDKLRARVLKKDEGTVTIAFEGDTEEIERIGIPPLPPYIARETPRDEDREAYQTVYAAERGAIAAPTAGLHFTREILESIAARGVDIVRITLHVGIGTFKPVKVDDIARSRHGLRALRNQRRCRVASQSRARRPANHRRRRHDLGAHTRKRDSRRRWSIQRRQRGDEHLHHARFRVPRS